MSFRGNFAFRKLTAASIAERGENPGIPERFEQCSQYHKPGLDETIAAVLAIYRTQSLSSEDKSVRILLEESGYFDCHEKVSEGRLRRAIAGDPNLIRELTLI